MKIIFMGTPDFAVQSLRALYESKQHSVVGVVTQPDRPKGRGGKTEESAVKQYAVSVGLPVLQPIKVKSSEAVAELKALQPDVIVVAAYGQILSKEILEMPKFGCVNVHGSLLPKYRGAAPVQYAIWNGETESGVTLMQMDQGMDTGSILSQVKVSVSPDMTAGELMKILATAGAKELLNVLEGLEQGKIAPQAQMETEATYAHLIKRESEIIDWHFSAAEIHNKIRAFNPEPGTYTYLPNGKQLKIWRSKVTAEQGCSGTVLNCDKRGLVIACGKDALELLEVQPESKKRMDAKIFVNGKTLQVGDVLVNGR